MRYGIEQVVSVLVFDAFRSNHAARKCVCYWNEEEGIGYDAIGGRWYKSVTDDFGGIVWIRSNVVYPSVLTLK